MEIKKKNQLNNLLTTIWLIVLCLASYLIVKDLPTDFWQWETINYTRAGLGIIMGMLFSLPLVWIMADYLALNKLKHASLIAFVLTFLPAIAKYIPGKIWSFWGFILQAKQTANISETDASFFQIYAFLIGLFSSIILTFIGITLLNTFKPSPMLWQINLGAMVLLVASLIAAYLLIKLSHFFNHVINKNKILPHLIIISLQKIGRGFSLILFLSAFLPIKEFSFEIGMAFIIAVQMGILAFFAPAGLGVTEGAYVMLLSDQLTVVVALQIAILARLWQISLDFLLAIFAFVFKVFWLKTD
jgi:hypothetical protein